MTNVAQLSLDCSSCIERWLASIPTRSETHTSSGATSSNSVTDAAAATAAAGNKPVQRPRRKTSEEDPVPSM